MQFVRRFWIAAVCTLGLLVSSTAVQAQQTKLLPNDTELVVTINLQQMMKSDVAKSNDILIKLAKQQIDQQLEEKGVAKYLEKAKFDLFKDLTSLTLAIPGGRAPEEGFIILEGNFDADKIEEVAAEVTKESGGGFKVTKLANVKAFEITPKDEKTMYIGILNKKTLIACSTKTDFTDAVGRFNGGKSAFKSASFKNLVPTLNNKQSISMVATAAVLTKLSNQFADKAPEGAGDQLKQVVGALQTLEGFSVAITIEKNIDFQLGVNAKDAKTATEYSQLANLGIGAAKAKINEQAKQNEKFAPAVEIVNSLKASTQGPNLIIRGQISFETLGKLLENLPIPQK